MCALPAPDPGPDAGLPRGTLRAWRTGLVGRAAHGGLRVRGLPVVDVVEFTAACPGCGSDCRWAEERDDTRVRIVIDCACRPA